MSDQLSWYVAFCPAPNRGLFRLAGHNTPTSHCFAFRSDPTNLDWLLVEPSVYGLDVRIVSQEAALTLIENVQACGHLVLYRPEPRRVSMVPAPMTCVAAIKALLSVHNWRIITPKQLLCELLRRGATPIVAPTVAALTSPSGYPAPPDPV
jgi:hypothetical protein